MLAGFYTIASGMLTQQRDLDVIGNNLVNQQTPGFRGERLVTTSFEKELSTRMEYAATGDFGTGAPASIVDEAVTLYHYGDARETGRSFDIALDGPGYFNVQTPDGAVFLTRGGAFDVDEAGQLILPGVGTVLGKEGSPLTVVGPGYKVDEFGEVYDQTGSSVGNLLLTDAPEGAALVKQLNGLFQPAQGTEAQPVENTRVVQGTLELSNMNMNKELTTMMEVQRAFNTCSSALKIIDGVNRKAASQLVSIS